MPAKTTVLLRMDHRDPDAGKLKEVLQACYQGKLVAFPTETVYGIGGPMNVPGLREAIAEAKSREASKPLSYHIADFEMVETLGVTWTPALRFLARKFWPGPLTLLVLNQKGEKIGLRFPRNHIASVLIQSSGEPFLGTSANISGGASPVTAQDVMAQLGGRIDFVIDGGKTDLAQDSTIVDLTTSPVSLVREGADAEKIKQQLELVRMEHFPKKKIMIVCTGNSCRSPMAEGWLKNELRKARLDDRIEVASCGTGARPGSTPSYEASLVLKNREIDISQHRSRPCSREEILMSDLIFVMSEEHAGFVAGIAPEVKERIHVLHIPDPIGMGMLIYEQVLAAIEKKLKACWKDIIS